MTTLFTMLAQTPADEPEKLLFGARDRFEVIGWFIVIIIGLILACIFAYRLYAKLTGKTNQDEEETAPFTLGELRRLHREGQLTDDEFEAAKAQIIGAYQKKADPDAGDESGYQDDEGEEDEDWGEWVPIDEGDRDGNGVDGDENDRRETQDPGSDDPSGEDDQADGEDARDDTADPR